MVKLLIGGDIVPTESNSHLFRHPEKGELVDGEIRNLFQKADYCLFNLEAVLTSTTDKIEKNGPHLSAAQECVNGLKNLGIDFVTLANNHIMDYGETGLRDTMDALENAGIAYAGAGETLSAAATPFFVRVGDCCLGVYCCTEHEFSVATVDEPGANPFDPLESLDHIVAMKKNCDYLLVLYHGGKEFYRYPSPQLKRICEKCVEKGADLVVCQHSHCVGSMEKYGSGTIVYGQGNFLFDRKSDEFWNTGILIGVELDENGCNIQYYPTVKESGHVRLADAQERNEILEGFQVRTKEIEDFRNVEKFYEAFAQSKQQVYLNAFLGRRSRNLGFRILKRLMGKKIVYKCFEKEDRVRLLNYLECEAHRELMIRFLKGK